MITIAHESPADIAAREALLDRVMPDRALKPSERLRRGRLPAISLVASDGKRVVGTVRLWSISAGGIQALLLGPLAVEPEIRGNGVGSALVRAALNASRESGCSAVILVGDPEFYGRFGFAAAHTAGLVMPAPVEHRRLLGLELLPGALDGASGRIVATGERTGRIRFARPAITLAA